MKTKTIFLWVTLTLTACIFSNCSQQTEKKELTVDETLAKADSLIGKTLTVEGVCTHVCSKSGMKLFLQGNSDDSYLRVESNATIGKFDKGAVDKKVRVVGTLTEERIDEVYLQKMEQDIKNNAVASHGEGGKGCATEQKAKGVAEGSSEMDRINDFRTRIEERKAKEGKDYLSFYHIAADSYRIIE